MEQLQNRYEVLRGEEPGNKKNHLWTLKDSNTAFASVANATAAGATEACDTIIEEYKIKIPESIMPGAKRQIQELIHGNIEDTDTDSRTSSQSSGSPKHKENGTKAQSTPDAPRETKVDIIEAIDGKLTDFDVEKILGTHDFCCPNCQSRTAIRVILKKRSPRPAPPIHSSYQPLLEPSSPPSDLPLPPPSPPASPPPPPPPGPSPEPTPTLLYKCLECFNAFLVGAGGFFGCLTPEAPPQSLQPSLDPNNSGSVPSPRTTWIEGPEIVKSIVFGGLNESIASLSVVASAAGAGSSTLNIFALALANLVGGFIVFIQSLAQLRTDQPRGDTDQQIMQVQDQYQELLGKRDHFLIHATLSILSYLIFGSMYPVLYAFLFRETDDRDLKLVVVGPVAVLLIILLAIGKANAQKKSYLKTVSMYLVTGIAASGTSFVVGDLLDRLLENLGWFNTNSIAGRNYSHGAGQMGMGLASY